MTDHMTIPGDVPNYGDDFTRAVAQECLRLNEEEGHAEGAAIMRDLLRLTDEEAAAVVAVIPTERALSAASREHLATAQYEADEAARLVAECRERYGVDLSDLLDDDGVVSA